jgi:hypothetical protein
MSADMEGVFWYESSDERIRIREGRRGVTTGTMLLKVGRSARDVMVVRGRELRGAVGPIRAMMEIHCGIEWKGRLRLVRDEMRGRTWRPNVGDERQGLTLADWS